MANQSLRKRRRLDQEKPMVVGGSQLFVDAMVHLVGRRDVEDCQFSDSLRMVESHTVGNATAPVVSRDGELLEAETIHDFYLVLGRGAFGVAKMIVAVRRLTAVTIATQVRNDQGEIFSQPWGNLMPHHMGLRIPVQQQDR